MSAEIIAIGSELTTGAKLDTNSQWLSLELSELGIPVKYHQTMADDLSAMVEVLQMAVNRSDLVIITGGLGPTLDDLTRQALAVLAGVELVLHQESLDIIRGMFEKRKRVMPERNVIQAMFPEGSEILPNRRGTAPGIWLELPRAGKTPCRLAALPGVPSEMKLMFREEVLPRLSGSGRVIRRARINCFGVGESDAEERLGDVTARGRDPEVGITAHEGTITLRITAEGETALECQQKIAETKAIIQDRMGLLVFGEEDEELEHILVSMLKQRGLTLATAESGTGGLLAHWLTDVPGFEAVYLGGMMAPTHAAKMELLGVTRERWRHRVPSARKQLWKWPREPEPGCIPISRWRLPNTAGLNSWRNRAKSPARLSPFAARTWPKAWSTFSSVTPPSPKAAPPRPR